MLILCTLLMAQTSWAADHDLFTRVLRDRVSNDRVDYAALKHDKRLKTYLDALAAVNTTTMSRTQRLAYYINLYNATTLKAVADAWPIASIKDIGGIGSGKVWSTPNVRLLGKTMTLNALENDIIRPMGDARFHFAVVCAALGCPPLRNEAYEASTLDAALDEQARRFLRSATWTSIKTEGRVAGISKIFDWYRADFGNSDHGILSFIAKYVDERTGHDMLKHVAAYRIEYLSYDWRVNAR